MNDKSAIRGLYVGWCIATLAFGFAVTRKHPHGFYVLLRWVCFLVFGYSIFVAAIHQRPAWAWGFAIEAVIFNQLVQVHFQRETWQMIDWFSVGSIGVAAAVFSKDLRTPQARP